ncbi:MULTISPECIES: hypothetical protein [unclassified Nostoc]|uniref:hypothetical protein n=1 Tax=unclassified Nostoc TaxID=2593658 RepID=UPI0025AA43D9|nr:MULTISPECIES: hypothetical protein [unclassified Nostoc]MDM9581850.1 hypothetical protein [Nostoc sp. GT001]MDZ7946458.1 hypothetical protein [Nostoc sp. EfeVER01]MDZ7994766.1 hypothetical protein [Nostoc sp. EspVER01]
MNKNTIPEAALLYPPPKDLQRNGQLETASTRNFTQLRVFQNLNLTLVHLVRFAQRKRDRRTLPV